MGTRRITSRQPAMPPIENNIHLIFYLSFCVFINILASVVAFSFSNFCLAVSLLTVSESNLYHTMPKVKRSKKPPPEGWELIEPTLEELEQKMREAETDPHEGKRKVEALWPIFKIHHQRSRYIYDLFYKRKAISRELHNYCLKENIADQNLIAKWKKQGYENLCCLRCIQTRDTNFGTNCICRVPKSKMEEGKIVECVHCGCRGCSG